MRDLLFFDALYGVVVLAWIVMVVLNIKLKSIGANNIQVRS